MNHIKYFIFSQLTRTIIISNYMSTIILLWCWGYLGHQGAIEEAVPEGLERFQWEGTQCWRQHKEDPCVLDGLPVLLYINAQCRPYCKRLLQYPRRRRSNYLAAWSPFFLIWRTQFDAFTYIVWFPFHYLLMLEILNFYLRWRHKRAMDSEENKLFFFYKVVNSY